VGSVGDRVRFPEVTVQPAGWAAGELSSEVRATLVIGEASLGQRLRGEGLYGGPGLALRKGLSQDVGWCEMEHVWRPQPLVAEPTEP